MDYKGLLIIIAFVLVLVLSYLDERNVKNKIRKFLTEKGYGEIEIRANRSLVRKGSYTFDVEYTDNHGLKMKYICRMHRDLLSDKKLHWWKRS